MKWMKRFLQLKLFYNGLFHQEEEQKEVLLVMKNTWLFESRELIQKELVLSTQVPAQLLEIIQRSLRMAKRLEELLQDLSDQLLEKILEWRT